MAFWKNITEGTDTPTNATNLSRSERYLEAVAGANGDFYVDIDGADGLEAGDILRIAFPAATNGASNARLSIDGASGTFRDIKLLRGFNNIPGKLVESGDRILKYDGTRWILESNLVAYWDFPTASANVTIPVDLNADRDYRLVVAGGATARRFLNMFFNNDLTLTNYYSQRMIATGDGTSGTNTSINRNNNSNFGAMTSNTDNTPATVNGVISKDFTSNKISVTVQGAYGDLNLIELRNFHMWSLNSFANVETITIAIEGTGTFLAGTEVRLYL